MASDKDLELIAAGFTAILGFQVAHKPEDKSLPKITIRDLFHCTYIPRAFENVSPGDMFDIHVKTIIGATTTVQVTGAHTIAEIKASVEMKTDIPARDQQLMFNKRRLQDHDTISGLGVPPSGTIFLLVRTRGGADFQLDPGQLDPGFHYDFTNVGDDGKTYVRGGKQYNRPYGWKRFAIKVLGVYESDTWLGGNGIRTQESVGEWPVSYHGTNIESAKAVAEQGYRHGPRQLFGKAVYSSPSVKMVEEKYAVSFPFDGSSWKIVLQNRVNPADGRLIIVSAQETGAGAEYWLSPKHDTDSGVHDVRPYGLLFRRV